MTSVNFSVEKDTVIFRVICVHSYGVFASSSGVNVVSNPWSRPASAGGELERPYVHNYFPSTRKRDYHVALGGGERR